MHVSSVVSGILCASVAIANPIAGGYKNRHHKPSPKGSCPNTGIPQAEAKLLVSSFTVEGIIPDLINRITPTVNISVAYGSTAVDIGTYFTTLETVNTPTRFSFTAEPGYDAQTTKYMYFLIDPDVPEENSPAQVNYEHWAVGNAQPYCVTDQDPVTVVAYEPPTPLSTTQHRYTFLSTANQPVSIHQTTRWSSALRHHSISTTLLRNMDSRSLGPTSLTRRSTMVFRMARRQRVLPPQLQLQRSRYFSKQRNHS